MSTNPISEELLPCPFCGAHPHHGLTKVEHDQLHGEPFQRFRVWCPHGCASKLEANRELAVAAWNRRASDSRANQAVVTEALKEILEVPEDQENAHDHFQYIKDIASTALEALSRAEGQEPVEVKPLEWITVDRAQALQASCVSGGYTIQPTKRGMCYVADWGGRLVKGNCSAEEAKAAAQADYDNRIRSALVKAPAPERGDGDADGVMSRVAECVKEYAEVGFWRTCSGCHESEDGYDIGHYPFSAAFGCKLGSGCSECGGIGAIWDTTDYAAMGEALAAPVAQSEPPAPAVPDGWSPHQHRVAAWMLECFGPKIAMDKIERADRFIEEALELAQATGWTPDRGHALVDYVFGRPVGEIGQEVGGVMVTLAAFCNALDVNIHAEAEREVDRITQPDIVLKIRAKQAAKPTGSALPIATPSQPLVRGEGE
ncbi:Phage protein [Devosia sp. DBB001]|nr:Phage protein [Devosia sp. DBB001]